MSATLALALLVAAAAPIHPWLPSPHEGDRLVDRFAPPPGFARVDVEEGGFAAFLRTLPLEEPGAPVRAFDGRALATPSLAVVRLDVGERDLQQCADSAIRLYAEWLYASGRAARARFHLTSGDVVAFSRHARGERFRAAGRGIAWRAGGAKGADRRAFRAWLDDVFTYAGSLSLPRDTEPAPPSSVQGGDLFVLPGSPGHVLVVLDVAKDAAGRSMLLLGEGFMPAQSFHVVPTLDGGAWHALGEKDAVRVPTWPKPFPAESLRRFRAP